MSGLGHPRGPAPRPRRWGRLATGLAWTLGVLTVAVVACTEDVITSPDPDAGPRPSPPTVEATLDATELPAWRDTTLVGFGLAAESPFKALASQPGFQARILGRFDVPDTARTAADTAFIERFVSGSINVRIDTARSEIPAFPVMFELYELTREFDGLEVDWERATAGEAWDTPGADLGALIATAELETDGDSVAIELPDPEDLLERWRDEAGQPGFAILVSGPEVRLRVSVVRLRFLAEIEDREEEVSQVVTGTPITFIFDPPQPEPGQALRVGGVPAARFYLEFFVPAEIGGVPLRGSTVNRAELRFHPLDPPPEPFALEGEVAGRPMSLLADPFELGLKTPIGPPAPTAVRFDPDSLAAGRPIRIDVTLPLQQRALRLVDLDMPIRIGIRWEPDAQFTGFWEFGSAEAPPGLRPELEIVLTAPPDFQTP